MRSSYDILWALYEVLNIETLPEVYFNNTSALSQGEFILVNTINNPKQYVQNGFGNVNIHVPNLSENVENGNRFKELIDIILPLLNDVTVETNKGTFHFQVDDDKGVFDDKQRDGMSYYNIKFEFQTL